MSENQAPSGQGVAKECVIRVERATLEEIQPAPGGQIAFGRANISGWAICQQPIELVVFVQDGKVLGLANRGIRRPDVAGAFPGYPDSGQCGFTALLENIRCVDQMPLEVGIVVTTRLGKKYECKFEFQSRLPSGPATADRQQRALHGPSLEPMRLHADQAEIDAKGYLRVSGWVVSLKPLVSVRVYVGDKCIGPAETGRLREDVGAAHAKYDGARHSGYLLITRCTSEELQVLRTIRIEAADISGVSRSLGMAVARSPGDFAPSPEPSLASGTEFSCDGLSLTDAGDIFVRGWAANATGIKGVQVLLGNKKLGDARIGLDRPEVGNAFPDIRSARQAGFEFQISLATRFRGEVAATVRVVDASDGTTDFPLTLRAVAKPRNELPRSLPAAGGGKPFRLHLDEPRCSNGVALEKIRGRFSVSGWALAREGMAAVDVYIDDAHVGQARYGGRRGDVQTAFPDWRDSLQSGFALVVPGKLFDDGEHQLRIVAVDKHGQKGELRVLVIVAKEPGENETFNLLRRKVDHAETATGLRILAAARQEPSFRLLIPVLGGKDFRRRLELTLRSLRQQSYVDWRAVLIPHKLRGGAAAIEELKASLPDDVASQIDTLSADETSLSAQLGPGSATPTRRRGAKRADPLGRRQVLLGFLPAGDELACDALLQVALSGVGTTPADFIYADERRISPVSGLMEAFLKPQWSPDLLLSTNYIGRCWFASAGLVESVALSAKDLLRFGGYDAVLRLTERATAIRHVPRILSERSADVAEDPELDRDALVRALVRRDIAGRVEDGCASGIFRVRREVVRPGMVSIIIPTVAARGLIKPCIESIRQKSTYRNFEIICLDNILATDRKWKEWLQKNADKVVEIEGGFNWSRFNNIGADHASGDYCLFLNDDIEVIEPGWLEALLEHAQRPDVGVVGPLLLYPDRKIQHAGSFLAGPGKTRHAFRYAAENDPGYFGLALTQRNMVGVTGACMLIEKGLFAMMGRFNEAHSVVNNDLDFCLRCLRHGKSVIYTPYAKLFHHELASRINIPDVYDVASFAADWRDVFSAGDPYFHPNLSLDSDDYSVDSEPLQEMYAGYPIVQREAIRRILVIKLDHIGDLVTALPAFRHLKECFPHASLTVLVGRSRVPLAKLEPAIDEVLDFEFFHVRSGQGYEDVTEGDLRALEARLAPYDFDLAIDFRKLTDTRRVLKYTGARFLAGFDRNGQNPWLDIAMEWEGDSHYDHKRQHVAADLLTLVDAVANACREDRMTILGYVARPPATLSPALAKVADKLFGKPVVCLHPASGNEMKQWPAEYFGELIDLLVRRLDVHVAIVGAPDDAAIVEAVLESTGQLDGVWSLVGNVGLSELPDLLSACALFVGNDSGPGHIAAGLGVPTVSVHSGVNSFAEWGPLGPDSVVLRRDMSCSPCYRARTEDCHRAMVCLGSITPQYVFGVCSRFLKLRDPGKDRPHQSHRPGLSKRRPS